MIITPEDIIRLVLSMFLGGMIGAERELRDKAAGLRTLMFISVGSTLFTILSMRFAIEGDPARVAAQIVSGVGFLGAGVILREGGEIRGLTTAATIWLAAALGMGVGAGFYLLSVAAGVLILLVLLIFPALERMMGDLRQVHTYRLTFRNDPEKYQAVISTFHQAGLRLYSIRRTRIGENFICSWTAEGRAKVHETIVDIFLADQEIISFEY